MLSVGTEILGYLKYLVSGFVIIAAIILTANMIRGSEKFFFSIKVITKNRYAFGFFIFITLTLIYFFTKLTNVIGI